MTRAGRMHKHTGGKNRVESTSVNVVLSFDVMRSQYLNYKENVMCTWRHAAVCLGRADGDYLF